MGVVRDITVEQLISAIGDIDTSGLAKDTTLQATNTALGNINTTLGGITTNDPPTDTTQQSIAAAISGLGATLGSDKANIDGSNIANPSAFRSNIGAAGGNLSFKKYNDVTISCSVGTTYADIPGLDTTSLLGVFFVKMIPSYSYDTVTGLVFSPTSNKIAVSVTHQQNVTVCPISVHLQS